MTAIHTRLADHEIQPTAQRVAIADVVLTSTQHPSADDVLAAVNSKHPTVSRATVYNTLNLFVERGLCRALVLKEGHTVYDPHLAPHHHLVDEESGTVYDLPFDAVDVTLNTPIDGFDVDQIEVVIRGRKNTQHVEQH